MHVAGGGLTLWCLDFERDLRVMRNAPFAYDTDCCKELVACCDTSGEMDLERRDFLLDPCREGSIDLLVAEVALEFPSWAFVPLASPSALFLPL